MRILNQQEQSGWRELFLGTEVGLGLQQGGHTGKEGARRPGERVRILQLAGVALQGTRQAQGFQKMGCNGGKENGSFRDVSPGCSLGKESAEETITCENS